MRAVLRVHGSLVGPLACGLAIGTLTSSSTKLLGTMATVETLRLVGATTDLLGRVVEWQTRWTQNPLAARP